MPGISFICDFRNDLRDRRESILRAMEAVVHTSRYGKEILIDEKSFFLCSTRYPQYPVTVHEGKGYFLVLEGKIYNGASERIDCLSDTIAEYGKGPRLKEWLCQTDGDFIVFIFNKRTKTFHVLNDILGRLPVYIHSDGAGIVISRELRFIVKLLGMKEFDRQALAQSLLLGYPVGRRTLFDGIYRVPPASLITVSLETGNHTIETFDRFNFGNKECERLSARVNAASLAKLFVQACASRFEPGARNIVSMSGGMDSRSVAAGLCKSGLSFSGTTRSRATKKESEEVKIARRLGAVFGIDWAGVPVATPIGRDLLRLLKLKSGMNHLGMGFILNYFEKIIDNYGPVINFFTGDGGDKVLHDLTPIKRQRTEKELLNFIISQNQQFTPDNVAALTAVPKEQIFKHLKEHLETYPEEDPNEKYVHFTIYERGINWLFEGEDRNRSFFWSVAPFYSVPFFKRAMDCPNTQKSQYGLYRDFLLQLSPEALNIENSNYGVPITSRKLPAVLFLYDSYNKLPGKFRKVLKKKVLKNWITYDSGSAIMQCLRSQMESGSLWKYFSKPAVESTIRQASKTQIDYLFSLTSIIEETECDESSIRNFHDRQF